MYVGRVVQQERRSDKSESDPRSGEAKLEQVGKEARTKERGRQSEEAHIRRSTGRGVMRRLRVKKFSADGVSRGTS